MKTYQCQKCDETPCTLTFKEAKVEPTVCPFDYAVKADWELIDDEADAYVGPGEIPNKATSRRGSHDINLAL